jgi:hypothetical protein
MAIATNAMKELLAVAYGNNAVALSLHTADPGTTGASEVTGGTPAYARKAVTWTAGGSDGVITGASVVFDLPSGVAVTHVGVWSALSAGTFLDKAAMVVNSQASQATVTVTPTYTQT